MSGVLTKGNGRITINVNKLLNDTVLECEWLDENHDFVQVMYSDWDSNELTAIINIHGAIIRKAIRRVEDVLEDEQLFIVEMSGFAMDIEANEFGLSDDDWKMAVIDKYGEFVIPPQYSTINYHSGKKIFCASDSRHEYKFSITGEIIT